MAQTSINIRIDEDLKKQFDNFCSEVGMSQLHFVFLQKQ